MSERKEPPLSQRAHGGGMRYCGSRQQLIAAGIIDESTPLPGDPGERKTYVEFEDHPKGIQVIRKSRERFTVYVPPAPDVAAAQQVANERRRIEAEVRRLPSDVESACDLIMRKAACALAMLQEIAGGETTPGFTFDRQTQGRLSACIQEICTVLACGLKSMSFQPERLETERVRRLSAVAKDDAAFAEFMKIKLML